MRKLRLRKKALLPLLIIILVIVLLIFFLIKTKDKSYSLEYDIGDYKISENYNQKEKVYYYEIKVKDVDYNFIYNSDYLDEKKLISNIKSHEKDDYTCLDIISSYLKTSPLCNENGELIDYHLIPIDTFNDLKNTYYNGENGYNYKNYNQRLILYFSLPLLYLVIYLDLLICRYLFRKIRKILDFLY